MVPRLLKRGGAGEEGVWVIALVGPEPEQDGGPAGEGSGLCCSSNMGGGASITFAELGWVCSDEVPVFRVRGVGAAGLSPPCKIENRGSTQSRKGREGAGLGLGQVSHLAPLVSLGEG